MDLNNITARVLLDCLDKALGLPVRKSKHGAQVRIDQRWCDCSVILQQIVETEDGIMAVAHAKLDLGGTYAVEDFVIGMGNDVPDAVISAVQQFTNGTVAPVAALTGQLQSPHHACNPMTTQAQTTCGGVTWNVSYGQVMANDADGRLYSAVDKSPPLMLIWNHLAPHLKSVRPHWVKVYLCRYPDGAIDGEVRIDNELDEQATAALESFVWPTDQALIWFRQFGYLEPEAYQHTRFENHSPNPLSKIFQWTARRA